MISVVQGVRDVQGTEIVVISRLSGALVIKDTSTRFSKGLLETLMSEVVRLFQCYNVSLTDVDEVFVRFSDKGLYARRSSHLIIGVVTDPQIDLDALRVASDLCLRQAGLVVPKEASSQPTQTAAAPPKDARPTSKLNSALPNRRTNSPNPSSELSYSLAGSWSRITTYLRQADQFITENAYTVRVYRYGYFRALDMTPIQVIISRVAIDTMFSALQRSVAQRLLEALNRYESSAWSDFERLVKEAIAIVAQIEAAPSETT